jgi:dTDP-4-dehydrorhamnose reductase
MYHLSDSMVFSGRTEMSTDDLVFPVNVFGLSRSLGEQGVLSFSDATVVRVGWLYGKEIESCPPMIAVDQAQGLRKSALIYSDMYGSPTFIGDAAVILAHHTIMFGPASQTAHSGGPIGFARVVHLAPTLVESWADLLEPSYPNVTPTTVRTSAKFRNLRRNAGLKPSMGWVVPAGGLSRFQDDLAGEWDFNNTVGTTEWWKEMYGES